MLSSCSSRSVLAHVCMHGTAGFSACVWRTVTRLEGDLVGDRMQRAGVEGVRLQVCSVAGGAALC